MRTFRVALVTVFAVALLSSPASAGTATVHQEEWTSAGLKAYVTDCPADVTTTCHGWFVDAGKQRIVVEGEVTHDVTWINLAAVEVAPGGVDWRLLSYTTGTPTSLDLNGGVASVQATLGSTVVDVRVVSTDGRTFERSPFREPGSAVNTYQLEFAADASGTVGGTAVHQSPIHASSIWVYRSMSETPPS